MTIRRTFRENGFHVQRVGRSRKFYFRERANGIEYIHAASTTALASPTVYATAGVDGRPYVIYACTTHNIMSILLLLLLLKHNMRIICYYGAQLSSHVSVTRENINFPCTRIFHILLQTSRVACIILPILVEKQNFTQLYLHRACVSYIRT